jgi:hypothetical protein
MSHTAERASELPQPAQQEGSDEGKDRVPETRSFRVPGAEGPARRLPMGHLRGLALGLALSLLNLAGAFLMLVSLGGLGEWTGAQFIGFFGLLEFATGLLFIVGPNIWRLPVAEAKLEDRTEVHLAASTVLIPHWAGGVKCIAGAAFIIYAAASQGLGPAAAGLPLVVIMLAAIAFGISLVAGRIGASRPDIDVFQLTLRRPQHEDRVLPPISIGASFVQFLLSIVTFPAIKLLSPDVLYDPEMGPSLQFLAWVTAAGLAALAAGLGAWWGRLSWRAPAPQQQEAEQSL